MLATHASVDKVKTEVITSFNQGYYDTIGHECVETWLKYWPTELELTCYVEEFDMPARPRTRQIPFTELGFEYWLFMRNTEKDRVKIFAKKAYSIIHAFEHSTADRIVWLDADVISQAPLPLKILQAITPADTLATFMGVKHDDWFSAETGIFVVNTQHPEFKAFAARYREYYDQRIKDNIRRFYDGEVFGAVVKEFEPRAKFNDLCKAFDKGYKTPLKHTVLGPYLHHYKAKHSKDEFVKNKDTK